MKLSKPWSTKLKLIFILLTISLVSYLPSLNNKFVWDDEQFIYNNAYIKNFEVKKIFTTNTIAGAGETSTYYRPLTTFSFAIDHQIWKLNPFGFHLTNTFLHTSAGIILFLFLLNLGISKNKSFWVSAIFLAHPLQTEAVVYANSRGDSMYAFFALLGLLTFSLLCKKKYPKIQIYNLTFTLNKIYLSTLTIIFYLLSILSKEIALASLGLFFLTFLSINFKNLLKARKKHLHIGTLFSLVLTAISYLGFRNLILNISTISNAYDPSSLYGSNIYVRLHTFTKALWTYFQLIFFPTNLHMERNLEVINKPISIWLILTTILTIFVLIVGYIELKKSEVNREAREDALGYKENHRRQTIPLTWFGFLWFIIMLVPVSGIVPINGLIYEHWLYMPLIGFSIFIVGITDTLFGNKLNKFFKHLLPIVVTIYIILTIKQNYIWGDPIRFYNYTLQFSQTARLTNNLAMSYAETGQNHKAIETYKKALEISDAYPQTYHNLGNSYLAINEVELAKDSFKKAISKANNFFPSYGPLINIFISEKNYTEALPLLKNLTRNFPTDTKIKSVYLEVELLAK